jgi:hypothetical protein
MLNTEEELGCLEILIRNFPNLDRRGLVIGVAEFLAPDLNLQNFICREKTVKEMAAEYIQRQIPYIVLDESEGYKCIFFKGKNIKAHYDVTNSKMIRFIEESN